MTKFVTFLVSASVCLIAFSCTDEMDEFQRTEIKTRELQSYLDEIGKFPFENIIPETETELSRTDEPARYMRNPDVNTGSGGWGYYILSHRSKNKQSKTIIDNIPPADVAGVIWPGALVQGRSVRDGKPALIPIYDKRKPGRISLNVVSGDSICFWRDIDTFSASDVTQAMNDILAPYTAGFPANTNFSHHIVHSKEEMAYYLNMDTGTFDATTKGVFSGIGWEKQTSKVMRLSSRWSTINRIFGMYLPTISLLKNCNDTAGAIIRSLMCHRFPTGGILFCSTSRIVRRVF